MNKSRNINLDLVKIVALASVISIHFFGFSGTANVWEQLLMNLSVFAIPFFLMTTGYLMHNKPTISGFYSKNIIKVLIPELLFSIIFLIYCWFVPHPYANESFGAFIKNLLLINATPYVWYVGMYIILVLLMPFLNILYGGLTSKKQKIQLLIVCFIALSLPVLSINGLHTPNWFCGPFYILYYYIGAFLAEYKPNIKSRHLIGWMLLIQGVMLILSMKGHLGFRDAANPISLLYSVPLFILIMRINLKHLSQRASKLFARLSNMSLNIFLSSAFFDWVLLQYVWKVFDSPILPRLLIFPLHIVSCFILSALLGYIVDKISKPLVNFALKRFEDL